MFYTAPMTARIAERLLLESRLRRASSVRPFPSPPGEISDGGSRPDAAI